MRRFRPDIVHGFKYDGNLYARIAGRIAYLGARVPVLGSERTDDHKVALGQRIGYRLTGMLSHAIVANTCGSAASAQKGGEGAIVMAKDPVCQMDVEPKTAAAQSTRCSGRLAPTMGAVTASRAKSQARATWAGVRPSSLATASTASTTSNIRSDQ